MVEGKGRGRGAGSASRGKGRGKRSSAAAAGPDSRSALGADRAGGSQPHPSSDNSLVHSPNKSSKSPTDNSSARLFNAFNALGNLVAMDDSGDSPSPGITDKTDSDLPAVAASLVDSEGSDAAEQAVAGGGASEVAIEKVAPGSQEAEVIEREPAAQRADRIARRDVQKQNPTTTPSSKPKQNARLSKREQEVRKKKRIQEKIDVANARLAAEAAADELALDAYALIDPSRAPTEPATPSLPLTTISPSGRPLLHHERLDAADAGSGRLPDPPVQRRWMFGWSGNRKMHLTHCLL